MASLVAQFTSSVRTGVAPLNVNFSNTSTGPYTSVRWDFGDGTQSSQINPTHQFNVDGVYQVTLTIFDDADLSSDSNTTITVFADDDYSVTSTTQQALFTNKRFSTGQVAVRKTVVDGSVVETQWPISGTNGNFLLDGNFVIPFSGYCVHSTSNGVDNRMYITDTAYSTPIKAQLDDGAVAHIALFAHTGSVQTDSSLSGSQMYLYTLTGYAGTYFDVDRKFPYFSGNSSVRNYQCFAFFSSTGSTGTTMIADSAYKALQGAGAIDGLETLNIPDMYNPDSSASGLLKYFEDDPVSGFSRHYVLPTYSGWNSVERWKAGSVRLYMPFVMWHNKGEAGVNLIDGTETYRDDQTNLEYTLLTIESDGTVVGRAFHEKKLISIDDPELQAAMSFLSNRSYTLPEPSVSTTNIADGTGGFKSGATYYVTYRVRDAASEDFPTGLSFGNGYVQPYHCRYVQEIVPSNDGNKMRLQAPRSNFYISSRGGNPFMTGFTASVVDVMIGSGETGGLLADATWHYSGDVGTYEELSAGIDIQYPSGTKTEPSFVDLQNSGNTFLAYGQDPFIVGYFSAISQSTIYKMATTCVAKNNEFNATQNETFDGDVNESVWISEVALYNENNELLMTGKLNTPVEKNDSKFVTIKLELDL